MPGDRRQMRPPSQGNSADRFYYRSGDDARLMESSDGNPEMLHRAKEEQHRI